MLDQFVLDTSEHLSRAKSLYFNVRGQSLTVQVDISDLIEMSLEKKLSSGKVTLISPEGHEENEKKSFFEGSDDNEKVRALQS